MGVIESILIRLSNIPLMVVVIVILNTYVRKNQIVRIEKYYNEYGKKQEEFTQNLAKQLISDVSLSI